MSASQQQQISLAVVSDIICPWCYIGYKELTRAIDQFKKVNAAAKVDVEYRPFLLDPKLSCKEPQEKVGWLLEMADGRLGADLGYPWSPSPLDSLFLEEIRRAAGQNDHACYEQSRSRTWYQVVSPIVASALVVPPDMLMTNRNLDWVAGGEAPFARRHPPTDS